VPLFAADRRADAGRRGQASPLAAFAADTPYVSVAAPSVPNDRKAANGQGRREARTKILGFAGPSARTNKTRPPLKR